MPSNPAHPLTLGCTLGSVAHTHATHTHTQTHSSAIDLSMPPARPQQPYVPTHLAVFSVRANALPPSWSAPCAVSAALSGSSSDCSLCVTSSVLPSQGRL